MSNIVCQILESKRFVLFFLSVGKKQLFWFFQRWLCALAKTKCAVCAVGFLYVAQLNSVLSVVFFQ